jgi:hypothetical protein
LPRPPRSGAAADQDWYTQDAGGNVWRQEYLKGQTEDHYRVVAYLGANALLTEEWTPLEPGVLDHKLYVRGTGTVLERTVKGGDELNELVSMTG